MNKIILLFLITLSIFAKDIASKKEDTQKNTPNTSNELLLKGEELKLNDEILKYINIEGYLRTGMNYRGNLDLNAFDIIGNRVVGSSKYKPTIEELKSETGSSSESTVSYNTRFRLSPNIIVGEYLRAVTTIDIFDNKLYGDNTESLLYAKEAYFEGKTPIGMISIGRMATGWGLGINRNSGKGKFSNYGNYIDQINYELVDFLPFMPNLSLKFAYEIKESTPQNNNFYINTREPKYDIEDRDDYVGFSLYLEDKIEGEELNTYLSKGNNRLNYGLFLARSWKDKITTINAPNDGDSTDDVSLINYEDYNLDYYTIDGFFEFYMNTALNIKGELVYITGTNEEKSSFNQWGMALQSNVNFLMKTLTVGLDAGIASGDTSDAGDPYNNIENSYTKDNFVFNLDFDIDLIFFKEISSLTNLYYIRPHVKWLATENISLELWSVTSISLDKKQTYGRDTYLGTELDMAVQYLNSDGLNFGVRSGVYLPGNGMDWLGTDGQSGGTGEAMDAPAELAFSIQMFLVMKF